MSAWTSGSCRSTPMAIRCPSSAWPAAWRRRPPGCSRPSSRVPGRGCGRSRRGPPAFPGHVDAPRAHQALHVDPVDVPLRRQVAAAPAAFRRLVQYQHVTLPGPDSRRVHPGSSTHTPGGPPWPATTTAGRPGPAGRRPTGFMTVPRWRYGMSGGSSAPAPSAVAPHGLRPVSGRLKYFPPLYIGRFSSFLLVRVMRECF